MSIDLNAIQNLSENDFKQQITAWINEQEIGKIMQVKLRKELIELFNGTCLGQQMAAKFESDQQMILSPFILALNTLVAEFLYEQNYHFALSVYASEIPYKNILPKFEKRSNFRFTVAELKEILKAIGWESNNADVQHLYNSSKENRSLLYCIVKMLLKSERKNKTATREQRTQTTPLKVETGCCVHGEQCHDTAHQSAGSQNLKYLNKYLATLSRRVKTMSTKLVQLQHESRAANYTVDAFAAPTNLHNLHENINLLTKKVELINSSESVPPRVNSHTAALVQHIDRLATRLERCANRFDELSEGIKSPAREAATSHTDETKRATVDHTITYHSWLEQIKATDHGRTLLDKMETTLKKAVDKEKRKLSAHFDQQLETHKLLQRINYRQKLTKQNGVVTKTDVTVEPKAVSADSDDKQLCTSNEVSDYLANLSQTIEKKINEAVKSLAHNNDMATIKNVPAHPVANPVPTLCQPTKTMKYISKHEPPLRPLYASNSDAALENVRLQLQKLEQDDAKLESDYPKILEECLTQREALANLEKSIWNEFAFDKTILSLSTPIDKQHSDALHDVTFNLDKPTLPANKNGCGWPQPHTQLHSPLSKINMNTDDDMNSLFLNNPYRQYLNSDRFLTTIPIDGTETIAKVSTSISKETFTKKTMVDNDDVDDGDGDDDKIVNGEKLAMPCTTDERISRSVSDMDELIS